MNRQIYIWEKYMRKNIWEKYIWEIYRNIWEKYKSIYENIWEKNKSIINMKIFQAY